MFYTFNFLFCLPLFPWISSSSSSKLYWTFTVGGVVSHFWRAVSRLPEVVLCMCGAVEGCWNDTLYHSVGRLLFTSHFSLLWHPWSPCCLGSLNLFSSVSLKKPSPARWTTEGRGVQPLSFWLTASALSLMFTVPGAFSSLIFWVLRYRGLAALPAPWAGGRFQCSGLCPSLLSLPLLLPLVAFSPSVLPLLGQTGGRVYSFLLFLY